jgi:hypothetical protein
VACRSDRHESGGGGPLIHSDGHRGSPVGFGRQTSTETEDRTMTDEMMSLRTLLEVTVNRFNQLLVTAHQLVCLGETRFCDLGRLLHEDLRDDRSGRLPNGRATLARGLQFGIQTLALADDRPRVGLGQTQSDLGLVEGSRGVGTRFSAHDAISATVRSYSASSRSRAASTRSASAAAASHRWSWS